MEPSALRELLAVLREAGATSARFEAGELAEVHLSAAGLTSGEFPTADLAPEDEDLPPGAYDPIKRRKAQRAKPPEPDEAS